MPNAKLLNSNRSTASLPLCSAGVFQLNAVLYDHYGKIFSRWCDNLNALIKMVKWFSTSEWNGGYPFEIINTETGEIVAQIQNGEVRVGNEIII